MDEYRFQVNLNWGRTQYFIALNLALFGTATTLASARGADGPAGVGALVVYAVGVLTSAVALAAGRTQRSYYHSARDLKQKLESRLDLGDLAIATTPGMRSEKRRFGKVHQVHSFIIGAVLVLDLGGALVAGSRLLQN